MLLVSHIQILLRHGIKNLNELAPFAVTVGDFGFRKADVFQPTELRQPPWMVIEPINIYCDGNVQSCLKVYTLSLFLSLSLYIYIFMK